MQQQRQIQGMQGQQQPERQAGFIAILLSSIFTFKTALWVARTTENILLANGFSDFPNIAGVLSVIAVLAEWGAVAHFIQFVIDEFIMARFYQDKSVRDTKRMLRQLKSKKGGFPWRWAFGLFAMGCLYLYYQP